MAKTFIKINENRIKLSNIKNYGISIEKTTHIKVYKQIKEEDSRSILKMLFTVVLIKWEITKELEPLTNLQMEYLQKGNLRKCVFREKGDSLHGARDPQNSGVIANNDGNYFIKDVNSKDNVKESDLVVIKKSYLYITTYQGDNYIFFEDEVEDGIYNKIEELDCELCT